jgi:hypothetical protein
LASSNHRLANNDAWRQITQNHHLQETGHDHDDLCNVIEDRRHLRARSSTPPRRSLAGDIIQSGRGGFRALAAPLRQVRWPEKFKAGHIDKYDGYNNPEEFIKFYHTVIEAARGDDRVKANYLPIILFGVTKSWLINLPEEFIYIWDQLCTMFTKNFQGTYEHPSTAETLKTIK